MTPSRGESFRCVKRSDIRTAEARGGRGADVFIVDGVSISKEVFVSEYELIGDDPVTAGEVRALETVLELAFEDQDAVPSYEELFSLTSAQRQEALLWGIQEITSDECGNPPRFLVTAR